MLYNSANFLYLFIIFINCRSHRNEVQKHALSRHHCNNSYPRVERRREIGLWLRFGASVTLSTLEATLEDVVHDVEGKSYNSTR